MERVMSEGYNECEERVMSVRRVMSVERAMMWEGIMSVKRG